MLAQLSIGGILSLILLCVIFLCGLSMAVFAQHIMDFSDKANRYMSKNLGTLVHRSLFSRESESFWGKARQSGLFNFFLFLLRFGGTFFAIISAYWIYKIIVEFVL